MPSPIAHCSLILSFWKALKEAARQDRGDAFQRGGKMRTMGLITAGIAALMGPDLDLLIGIATGEGFAAYHNTFTHSLFMVPLFAVVYAGVFHVLFRGGFAQFLRIGAAGFACHVMLDSVTFGRGVQLFWPMLDERFSSPVHVFRGVRHSVNAPLFEHFKTVSSELLFVAVYGAMVFLKRRSGLH